MLNTGLSCYKCGFQSVLSWMVRQEKLEPGFFQCCICPEHHTRQVENVQGHASLSCADLYNSKDSYV